MIIQLKLKINQFGEDLGFNLQFLIQVMF